MENNQVNPSPDQPLVQFTHIIYGLQAASLVFGITALAAIIMNYIKLDEVKGTWLESHFNWQIRTFWIGLIIAIIGFILVFVLIGFVVLFALAVWLIYRIVKGWLLLSEKKPIPNS